MLTTEHLQTAFTNVCINTHKIKQIDDAPKAKNESLNNEDKVKLDTFDNHDTKTTA